MHKGEIGRVEGIRFVLSTNMWNVTNGTTVVYNTIVLSPQAFGVTEIEGGIKTYVKTPNQYDTNNPLNQWSTIGYKMTNAVALLNRLKGVNIFTAV